MQDQLCQAADRLDQLYNKQMFGEVITTRDKLEKAKWQQAELGEIVTTVKGAKQRYK